MARANCEAHNLPWTRPQNKDPVAHVEISGTPPDAPPLSEIRESAKTGGDWSTIARPSMMTTRPSLVMAASKLFEKSPILLPKTSELERFNPLRILRFQACL